MACVASGAYKVHSCSLQCWFPALYLWTTSFTVSVSFVPKVPFACHGFHGPCVLQFPLATPSPLRFLWKVLRCSPQGLLSPGREGCHSFMVSLGTDTLLQLYTWDLVFGSSPCCRLLEDPFSEPRSGAHVVNTSIELLSAGKSRFYCFLKISLLP